MQCRKPAKTLTWNLHNTTPYYVLVVDGFFGYFDNEDDFEKYKKKADQQFSLCHSSMNCIMPHTECFHDIEGKPSEDITLYQPIDIVNYINTRVDRVRKRASLRICDTLKLNNLPSRFVDWKSRDEVVPGYVDINWDDISFCTVDSIWKRTVHGVDYNKYCYDDGFSILIGG